MHEVQAFTRRGVPSTSARTRWMCGADRRLVRLAEERLLPTDVADRCHDRTRVADTLRPPAGLAPETVRGSEWLVRGGRNDGPVGAGPRRAGALGVVRAPRPPHLPVRRPRRG